MHILSVLCIGWVLGMQVICIELSGLYVMFIPSVNEHYGHYFIVIACLVKPWFVSHSFYLIALGLSHMPYKFSAYNDQIVLLCFRSYLFIWFKSLSDSRVRCEWVFVHLFPTHNLSLEFVLGWILSTILLVLFCAKFACILAISNPTFRWESCKGSVWQSEELLKILQRNRDSRLDLAGGLWLASRQNIAHVPSMPKAEESCQLLHYRTKVPG